MAYSPSEKYPGAVDVDPDYQGGKFRDNNPSTTNNGSPLKAIDRNELLARDEAIMNDAGFEYSGVADTPQDSQLFKAYKASLGNGANLLSNHNFLVQTPDDSQPLPSATPTSYPPGYQIFSGVFANETTGITNLTYIDGRVSFSGGDLYFAVPNAGGIERLTSDQLTASVSDFDGKPRTRGVSFALVGDEYRVTVGIDALEDVSAALTPLGSVKFEEGKNPTKHQTTEGLTAQTVGGVTNYQAASVQGMKDGKTLKGQISIAPSMIDAGDISMSTQGYYGGWNALANREPTGQSKYTLTTLQRVRDSKQDQSWIPDGWVAHYLSIGDGLTYVAIPVINKHLNVCVAGAIPDAIYTSRETCDNLATATDNSDAFTAAFNYSKSIRFPRGSFAHLQRILPKAHDVTMSPDTTLYLKSGGSNIFRISRTENVHIKANGAWAVAPSDYSATSSTVYTEGLRDSSISDLHVKYSGGGFSDCYYLGDGEGINGYNGNRNLRIKGGSAWYATRNCVSWISYEGVCSHSGMDIAYATGDQLGLGIDVEANRYGQTEGKLNITGNYIHDNGNGTNIGGGVAVIFGNNVKIENNNIKNNTVYNVATNAGGTEFNQGVARKQDVRGVSAFSTSDGWVTISNGTDDDETAINAGDRVQFILSNGATLPPEITGSSNRMCVNEVDRAGGRIRVGTDWKYGTITSFSNTGTGNLDLDPWVSDVRLNCSAIGQVSNIDIKDNIISGAAVNDIEIQQFSRDVNTEGNKVTSTGSAGCVRCQYSQDVRLIRNELYVDRDSTADNVNLQFGQVTRPETKYNKLYNSRRRALYSNGCSDGVFTDDQAINSMQTEGFRFERGANATLRGLKVATGSSLSTGLIVFPTVSNSLIEGAMAEGATTSNAASLQLSGTNCRYRNNVQFDGTFRADN
ncbi:pectin lyase fold/virulence factor [Vibrio phage 1.124.O._10N.286.49.B1]|nr:pectin lyase fold/virulence factor [Vibrio phage 1.124.O._10N.286.49.B1]